MILDVTLGKQKLEEKKRKTPVVGQDLVCPLSQEYPRIEYMSGI